MADQRIVPFIGYEDAAGAIEWLERAFGFRECRDARHEEDGTIGHAELELGDSVLMLADPFPQFSTRPPKELGGTTTSIFMYSEDVDAAVKKAVDAGATVLMEPDDMFWGDRFGSVSDPFGHVWAIATHKEDLTPEEMAERSKAAMAAMSS
jgi:PhnB protein